MTDEERGKSKWNESCDAVEGGYSIFLDGETIDTFMESGDFSSARELEHFKDVGAQVERSVREGEGLSLLALSATEKRISRDFAVLQIAHLLAKHGKNVLIVDCDFLSPGLSGLIEDVNEHGFLDLLLYGSSLKTVTHGTGIDGVSVTGPGSFPVSKTVPFAQKEFGKVKEFLSKKSNVVIYCSTLYTEEGKVNPLCTLVDGIFLCCRIEEMGEGQLQSNLADLGPSVPPVELICFCGKKEQAAVVTGGGAIGVETGEKPVEEIPVSPEEKVEKPLKPSFIEKTEEIDDIEIKATRNKWLSLPRLLTIVTAVVVIGFLAWWFLIDRSIRRREATQKMNELVEKQREAREAVEKKTSEPEAEEPAPGEQPVDKEEPEAVQGEVDKTAEPPEAQEAPSGKHYALHVASFKEIARAGAEVEYLESNGFEAKVVEVEVKGEKWFRILVGEFSTREEANSVRTELLALRKIGYAEIVDLEKK